MAAGSDDDKGAGSPELSLDPKTWLKGEAAAASPPPGAVPDAGASFDPRTWARPADAAAPPQPPSEAAVTTASPPSRRLLLIGGGAGLLLVGVAGAGLWLKGRSAQGNAAAGADAATERQVLTLPGVAALAPALKTYGFDADASGKIAAAAAGALPQADGELRMELALARAGKKVSLASLALSRPDGSGVRVVPAGAGFAAEALAANTRKQVKVARGQIDSESFYSSAVSAGLSDALIPDFFQAFVYDFDFQREIEPGDVFEAAFEETVNDRGEPIGAKRLIYASMTTKAKSRALYAFTEAGQAKAGWFDGAGRNIRRGLMKTPVEGARISSNFGGRKHPVLGYTRMHKGTDFATPVGTPVFASADGEVTFVGLHGGHGNYVAIKHTPELSTAYAHLSQYGEGIKVGARVSQGQQIALSGNTGLSSGPHLHYEVIVNGEQVDSQTYQTEEGHALDAAQMQAFARERDRIDAARAASL